MRHAILFVTAAVVLLAGCGDRPETGTDLAPDADTTAPVEPGTTTTPGTMTTPPGAGTQPTEGAAAGQITVELSPTAGNTAAGRLTLSQSSDSVQISGEITGLTPGSTHGFHVHEFGDCSAPDGSSAGGHFNPAGSPHGGPTDGVRHLGDLANIIADTEGRATVSQSVTGATLVPGMQNSLMNRSIVVHADADDYKTQPAGNSGARLACGVIGGGAPGATAPAP